MGPIQSITVGPNGLVIPINRRSLTSSLCRASYEAEVGNESRILGHFWTVSGGDVPPESLSAAGSLSGRAKAQQAWTAAQGALRRTGHEGQEPPLPLVVVRAPCRGAPQPVVGSLCREIAGAQLRAGRGSAGRSGASSGGGEGRRRRRRAPPRSAPPRCRARGSPAASGCTAPGRGRRRPAGAPARA